MNLFQRSQVKQTEEQMLAYTTLLTFRYMNLCVKAEPASLMPVNVPIGGEMANIEEVAQVCNPDDYHLAIIPKNDDVVNSIVRGVMNAHPEFKLERKTIKQEDGEELSYLLYEMPEVDSNRRDFLKQTAKSLYEEAKARVDTLYADTSAGLIQLTEPSAEEAKELTKALDKLHDDDLDKLQQLLLKKDGEIDDGYHRYLTQHVNDEESDDNPAGYDVVSGMRMTDD